MTAIVGYKGQVLITSSPSVSATNFVLVDSGDHQTFNANTSSTQRYWDSTQLASFVVATSPDGTTWTVQSTSLYTVSRFVNGQVKFNSALSAGTQVRMNTVYYFPYSTLGDCHEWNVNVDTTVADATVFSTTGWKSNITTLHSSSAKLAKFWVDGTFLSLLQALMVVVLYPDQTSLNRYEGYAWIKSDAIKDPVAGLIDEEINVEINGQLYYMTT